MAEGKNKLWEILHLVGIALALCQAAVIALVLRSRYGIGDGSGVIAYSIGRSLVLLLVHVPFTFVGVSVSLFSLTQGRRWALGVFGNILVFVAAVLLYLAQHLTVDKFMGG